MIKEKKHIWIQKAKGVFKCQRCGIWKTVEQIKPPYRKYKERYFRDNFEDKSISKKNCFILSKD
jgi:hypothetical protein